MKFALLASLLLLFTFNTTDAPGQKQHAPKSLVPIAQKDLEIYMQGIESGNRAPFWDCYLKELLGADFTTFMPDEFDVKHRNELLVAEKLDKDIHPGKKGPWLRFEQKKCLYCEELTHIEANPWGDIHAYTNIEREKSYATFKPAAKTKKPIVIRDRAKMLAKCSSQALLASNERYLKAEKLVSCDDKYSAFIHTWIIAPGSGRVHFHDSSQPNSSPRKAYVIGGDRVDTTHSYKTGPAFRCSRFRAKSGRSTVGWLPAAKLIDINHLYHGWLGGKTYGKKLESTLKQLRIWASGSEYVEFSGPTRKFTKFEILMHGVNGHICNEAGPLTWKSTHRAEYGDPADKDICHMTFTFGQAGLAVKANNRCGGARAWCDGTFGASFGPIHKLDY